MAVCREGGREGGAMRLCGALLKSPIPKQIEYYSRFSPSPLSIKQFLDFGEWRRGAGSGGGPRGCPQAAGGAGAVCAPPPVCVIPACCRGSVRCRRLSR